MLARDVVRSRLEAGISYTEFSYVLLQSMDFLNLYRDHGVTLQFGGSDQWGNLTGGVELVRRAEGGHVHAFATPLVTKADGTKYGKTEGGALWLDPQMLSPYAFHQFWLNVEDEKVGELLRIFTFLPRAEIEELDRRDRGGAVPAGRAEAAGRRGDHAGARGRAETEHAKAAAAALFGGGDLRELDARDAGGGAARDRGGHGAPRRAPTRRPAGGLRAGQEQGGGPAHHRRGRCLPQQRARHRRRPRARPRGPRRGVLAGAAPRQEEPRGRRGRAEAEDRRPASAPRRGGSPTWSRAPGRAPAPVLRYVSEGARDEVTLGEASEAWREVRLLPRVLRDVREVDTSPGSSWAAR